MPIARACRAPVNVPETTAIDTGKISAAPMPCTTRATMSQISFGATPQMRGKDAEHGEPDHDDLAAAEDVGQPARGHHQRADREHVAADHPLQVGRRAR